MLGSKKFKCVQHKSMTVECVTLVVNLSRNFQIAYALVSKRNNHSIFKNHQVGKNRGEITQKTSLQHRR